MQEIAGDRLAIFLEALYHYWPQPPPASTALCTLFWRCLIIIIIIIPKAYNNRSRHAQTTAIGTRAPLLPTGGGRKSLDVLRLPYPRYMGPTMDAFNSSCRSGHGVGSPIGSFRFRSALVNLDDCRRKCQKLELRCRNWRRLINLERFPFL